MSTERYRWQNIKNYIHFMVNSSNLHKLHSPFMFDLARKCLYDHTRYSDYQKLKKYHKDLLNQSQKIQISDLGAGSQVFQSNTRRISQMAKVAGSSYADMKRLYRLVHYFKPRTILELGTSLGKSAFAMACADSQTQIISVEGDRTLAQMAQRQLDKFQISNVQIRTQNFETFLLELNQSNQKFDMVFMDGNHRLEPTLKYFNLLQKHLHNDSVVLVDDIYWSEEMKQAWQQLKQHPQVRQSVDVFYFGILFFRQEQFEQDFIINLDSFNLF